VIEILYFSSVMLLALVMLVVICIIWLAAIAAVLAVFMTAWAVLRSLIRGEPIQFPIITFFLLIFGELTSFRKAVDALFSKQLRKARPSDQSFSSGEKDQAARPTDRSLSSDEKDQKIRPFDRSFSFSEKEKCLAWLASERKPELWPDVISGIHHDNPDAVDYIKWIVEQPDCDIGTAIVALGLTYCYEAIYLDSNPEKTQLAEIICRNSQAGFYRRNTVGGLAGGRDKETDPVLIMENIRRGCENHLDDKTTPNLPIPYKILQAELPDESPKHDYYIDESGIFYIDDFDDYTVQIIRGMNP
jgi:hypothetical protein